MSERQQSDGLPCACSGSNLEDALHEEDEQYGQEHDPNYTFDSLDNKESESTGESTGSEEPTSPGGERGAAASEAHYSANMSLMPSLADEDGDYDQIGSISSQNCIPNAILHHQYDLKELVNALGNESDMHNFPVELERRVRDFRLAQSKRRQTYGQQKRWGIFGMYAHLADVRTDLEWAEDAAWRRAQRQPYLSWSDFEAAARKSVNRWPWFTYFITFVSTVMLIVEFALNDWKIEPLSVNPMIGPGSQALLDAGARATPQIVEEHQWYRLFSPLILHAGIIHFVINMIALWFLGSAIEKTHGVINTMILFIIPGVGGNILSAIFLPQYISVGASGGIFGLVGGCLADISLNWKLIFIKDGEDDTRTTRRNIVAIAMLAFEIVINILLGLAPFIDNFTHLGGLIYGVCSGWSCLEPITLNFFGIKQQFWEKTRSFLIRFFGLIVAILLIVASTVYLATSDVGDVPCSSCRYISCVPFPFWSDDKWWQCDDCAFVTAQLYNTNGDAYYDRIDLTCPNGVVEVINATSMLLQDQDQIGRDLPDYCREYCDDVFA